MSDAKNGGRGKKAPGGTRRRLDPESAATPDDLVEALIGRRPSDAEAREADWYQRVRAVMRMARDDSEKGQTDLAKELGVAQSEVSRLETSLGPGTRLDKLRGYLQACAARMSLSVETAKGAVHEIGAAQPADTSALEPEKIAVSDFVRGWSPWSILPVTVDNVALQGRDLQVLATALPALDAALADAGANPEQAERIRHRFLVRFRALREQERAHAAAPQTYVQQTD